jgi:uncharacterized protein HemY
MNDQDASYLASYLDEKASYEVVRSVIQTLQRKLNERIVQLVTERIISDETHLHKRVEKSGKLRTPRNKDVRKIA